MVYLSRVIGTKGRSIFLLGIIISLLIGFTPVKLLSQHLNNSSPRKEDILNDIYPETTVNCPRLMNTTKRLTKSRLNSYNMSYDNFQNNRSISNFAINSQSGLGKGSINIRDSYNWTGIVTINTTNEINQANNLPTQHNDSITISHSSDYIRQKGWFNVSNVIAERDYRLIEDYEYDRGFVDSKPSGDAFYEIAMSFMISEDLANLTKIRTYTSGSGQATGVIYIVNSTSGEPDDTKILSSKISLIYTNPQWNEYEFNEPIILKGGIKYFVVMNSTSKNKVWNWFYQNDTLDDGSDDGEVYYKKASHIQNDWTFWETADLPLIIEVLPIEYNGSVHPVKSYTYPTEISFSYSTSLDNTEITSFVWFEWNDTETHIFQTNTSVSFILTFIANYTYSLNPINGTTNYLVNNGTTSLWNVTFSTNALNKTFSVRNRTITIENLNADWNGSAVYHNGSYVYNSTHTGGLNGSITYMNGSNNMIVNSSNLSDAKEWVISFNAPNYIQEFNWLLNTYPVTSANATDILSPNIILNPKGVGGKNLTVFIESGSGIQVYHNTNKSISSPILDDWDINQSTLSLPEANGTYESAAFWFNGTSNQVGFFTREIRILINTTFSIDAPSEILINSFLNITVHYNATHNFTAIDNANITGKPSWGSQESKKFSQIASREPYNISWDINDSQHLPGDFISVVITCQLRWYINHSSIITIRVIDEATLSVNSTDVKLQWRENITLLILYNDSVGSPITGAIISVAGDSENVTYSNGAYYYKLNSTNFAGVGSYSNNEILATHSNYSSKKVNFSVTITPGNTSVSTWSNGQPIANNTSGYTQIYANSSKDNVSINLRYYYVLMNDTLTTSSPFVASILPYYAPLEEENNTWTLTFNPNQIGFFLINITFSLSNYNSSTFCFHLSVKKAGTSIFSPLPLETNIYYNESFQFFLVYNNINYNENITGLTNVSGITISNNSKVVYLNYTGDLYWFQFAPTTLLLGIHTINITFEHIYYNASSITIIFDVIPRPTNITGSNAKDGSLLNNKTSIFYRGYSPGSYDNFSIWLRYYDVLTGQTLIVSSVYQIEVESSISFNTPVRDETSYNWSFTFEGSIIGTYYVNITFSLENHSFCTFMVIYILQEANTQISQSSINPYPSQTKVTSSNTFEFWIEWKSEYNEGINDSNGVTINSTDIYLFDTGPITGNHTFHFNKSEIGIYTYNLTFQIDNYTKIAFLIQFNVTPRIMILDVSLSTHDTGATVTALMYGDIYPWTIFLNDSETGLPVTASPISPLPTNITFNGGIEGNHSFSYDASDIGTFSSLVIVFSLANYKNYTYIITFIVDKRRFFFDSALSTVDNDSAPVQIKFNNSFYFNVYLRDEKTQNPVNASIVIVPENITAYSIVFSGNHSFRYYAGDIGQDFNLSIIFVKSKYHNLTYFISFNVFSRTMAFDTNLSTHTTPAVVNLQYGDIYYFKIYVKDNETGTPLNIPDPSGLTENLTLVNTSSGYHMFRFQARGLQPEIIDIVFALVNYQSITFKISFFITEANSEIVSTSSTITTTYSIDKEFFLIWQSIPNPLLNTSPVLRINCSDIDIQMSSSEWSKFFIFQGYSNGNYTFFILADKTGSFTVMLEFQAEGFKDASIQIQIIILPVATSFFYAAPANASSIEEPFYFTESRKIVISWIEAINGSGLVETEPEYDGNGTDIVILADWFSNGTHIFDVSADKIGTYQVRITFNMTNYQVLLYILTIPINPMKTNKPTIIYPSELSVGEQLFVTIEEWVTINNERVPISNLEEQLKIWNGSNAINFAIANEAKFTVIINTDDYRKGIHNLQLFLSCYGFEDQSMNIMFNLLGRTITITIEIIPEEIVQGSDFRIKAILDYEPLTVNIAGFGSGLSLQSLKGVEVSFEVEILYERGNTKTLYNTSQAQALEDSKAFAEFTIKGEYSIGAEGISRIKVTTAETASGLAGSKTTPNNFVENYRFKKQREKSPIVIDPMLFIVLIILGLSFCTAFLILRSYQSRIQAYKGIQKEVENRFNDLLNLRGIIFRNNHGVTFYTENFRIKDQDGELIAGLSTAMSSLVDQVTQRNLKKGEFDILEREGFGIFSHQGKFSVLSIISSGKLSKYLRNRMEVIHENIEKHFTAENLETILITSIKKEVKKIIYDNLPLGLLKPLLVENKVLKDKINTFEKTEKKMCEILSNVPSFIDGQQVFFALTLISSLTTRGITLTDAILFLEKLHTVGGLRNLTVEELYALNIPEDYISI